MYPVWLGSLAGTGLAGDQRRAESRGGVVGREVSGTVCRAPCASWQSAQCSRGVWGTGLSVWGPPRALSVQAPHILYRCGARTSLECEQSRVSLPPSSPAQEGSPGVSQVSPAAFLKKDSVTLSFTKSCTRGTGCQDISTRAPGRFSRKAHLSNKWCWTTGRSPAREGRGTLTTHRSQVEMVIELTGRAGYSGSGGREAAL